MYLRNLASHRSNTAKVLAAGLSVALLCFTSFPVLAIKNADNLDNKTPFVMSSSVALAFTRNKGQPDENCTGTVLTAHLVLTAGHCYPGLNTTQKVKINGKELAFKQFKAVGTNTDVAVVTFDNKNTLKDTPASTRIHVGAPYANGTQMLIAGAGSQYANPSGARQVVQKTYGAVETARVQVALTRQDGRIVLRGPWGNPPAGDRIDACKGDSGGGAWFQVAGNYMLVAVASNIDGGVNNLCPDATANGTAYTVINAALKASIDSEVQANP
jgi:hypothetical protein